ncbi:hypothetical protein GCM10025868_14000 [Angustibacter aerolatus]|uniref:DUF3626 domain-containing protein n=1 Tax=Angustibacter aerolatus TaxID=1162965 RepID=A0ABQ6JG12_9ACTN|nr:hypothetical protein GCM10025868_14000 [Angustibacter aerolatus]
MSQFVTGTSNGGLTAHPGGDRWRWESRLFGGAYDDAAPEERPVYGSLDHARRAVGGSPRFGSAFFRLRPEVLVRTTFCWPDSVFEPTDLGVAQAMRLVRLLEEAADVDPLDRYVEAHVHGPVRLADDVEALVLDPSHRGTDVETAAGALGCPVEWHPGFRLTVDLLQQHAGYRGPEAVALGERLAVDGVLTPRVLGEAVGPVDPQHLKWLWHCLARFGAADRPA